jgi:hypothetical protein
MFFRGRHMPVGEHGCRSSMWQRRLSTAGNKFRIPSDNGGLGAGRQQAPSKCYGKQPGDVPNSRDHGRAGINTVRLNVDARNSGTRSAGTVDGRHVVSPICAPAPKPKSDRPQGRTQSGRNRGRIRPGTASTTRFQSGVMIAPQSILVAPDYIAAPGIAGRRRGAPVTDVARLRRYGNRRARRLAAVTRGGCGRLDR